MPLFSDRSTVVARLVACLVQHHGAFRSGPAAAAVVDFEQHPFNSTLADTSVRVACTSTCLRPTTGQGTSATSMTPVRRD